ncbi:unnamed protein product, partial [Oppiella nova]
MASVIDHDTRNYYVYIYSGLIGALFVTALMRSTTWFMMCMRASVNLHNSIFSRLLRAPIAVFDNNPIGQMLNRFSKDMGIVDEMLPTTGIYMKSARDIKRFEGITRSPVFTHVSTTLNGLDSVRAYGAQEAFEHQYYIYQNDHTATCQMTSVERIIEYQRLPQEAPLDSDDTHRPPPDWPSKG